MDPLRRRFGAPPQMTQPFPTVPQPGHPAQHPVSSGPALFAPLAPRGRSLSMSQAARMFQGPPPPNHRPANVPQFQQPFPAPLQQAFQAPPHGWINDRGGMERSGRLRSNSMSQAERCPIPAITQPFAPLRASRPDLPAVQRKLDGTVVFGPSASLSDAMPFLNTEGSADAKLVASFDDEGSITMAWQRFRALHPGKTSDKARAALKHLIENIPTGAAILRPFLEWHANDVAQRSAHVISDVHSAIERCSTDLDRMRDLTPATVRRVLRPLAERMHRVAMMTVPGTRAQRDAPRAPVDYVVDWMVALRATVAQLPATSVHRRKTLSRMEEEARHNWLMNPFDPNGLSDQFAEVARTCRRSNVPELASLANRLSFELGRLAHGGGMPLSLLYENNMVRAWETSFVNTLVQNPPEGALRAAGKTLSHLAARMQHLKHSQPDNFDAAVHTLYRLMKDDVRFWMPKVPAIQRFVDAHGDHRRGNALLAYLEHGVRSGEDCVSAYYTTVKLSRALRKHAKNYLMWDNTPQDVQDFATRDAARAIIKQPGYYGLGTGLHLAHQPGLSNGPYMNEFHSRPSLTNRPNLSAPSPAVQSQLASGATYGSGPSGSAGFACKFVDFINRHEDARIDPAHAVLGAFMFVCYDGGHALNEVMWEMNLLKSRSREERIDMGIRGQVYDPNRFVGRFQDFFDSFPRSTRDHLKRASNRAFEDMLRYDRQQSSNLAF
jgi:hypothetical protein